MAIRKRFSAWFKTFDIYGEPVGVNFKGSNTYQTKMGATATLISYLLIMIYSAYLVTIIINKSESSVIVYPTTFEGDNFPKTYLNETYWQLAI